MLIVNFVDLEMRKPVFSIGSWVQSIKFLQSLIPLNPDSINKSTCTRILDSNSWTYSNSALPEA